MRLIDITFAPYIPTTVLGLLGLLFFYLYRYYRSKDITKLQQLKTVRSTDRIKAMEMLLNDLGVQIDTSNIDPVQKFELLVKLLSAKTRKYLITAITLVTLSLIVAFLIWSNYHLQTISAPLTTKDSINNNQKSGPTDSVTISRKANSPIPYQKANRPEEKPNLNKLKTDKVHLKETSSFENISALNSKYDVVLTYSKNIYRVKKENEWGLVTNNDKIIMPLKCKMIGELKGGIAEFTIEQNLQCDQSPRLYHGAFNSLGNMSIEPKYLYFVRTDCEVICVSRHYQNTKAFLVAGLISLKGEELFDFDSKFYTEIRKCCNDKFPVAKSDLKWGACDNHGVIVYDFLYTYNEIFTKLGCK